MVTDQEKKTGLGDLDYWLATRDDLCRLLTRSPDYGLVAPVYGWGSMAVRDQETFAYLTKRPAGETGESELGVCAYGPDSEELASRVVERIRAWDTGRRLATRIEVSPSGAQAPDSGILLVADKRHIRVIVRVVPIADRTSLFTLDLRAEPAEDLTGYACSEKCTDDGCAGPTTNCRGNAGRSGRPLV